MLRLEKIEFGGIKGKAFSDQVLGLFEEFNALFKSVSELTYDPLDTTDKVNFIYSYWPTIEKLTAGNVIWSISDIR